MTRLRTSGRPRGRRVIGRTLLAAALLTAVAAVPAAAVVPQGAPAAATARAAAPAYEQVVHFYGAYIDAVAAEDGGELASSLRDFYLTPGLRAELGDWEEAHGADGVLHAQNAPAGLPRQRRRQRRRAHLVDGPAHLGGTGRPRVHVSEGALRPGDREDLRHPGVGRAARSRTPALLPDARAARSQTPMRLVLPYEGAPQHRVLPVPGEEFVVGAVLDDAAVVHHHDPVGAGGGGEAVGDDEGGAAGPRDGRSPG